MQLLCESVSQDRSRGRGGAREGRPVSRAFCLSFFFQAEDGIRDLTVTGVQTCALPISASASESLITSPRYQSGPSGSLSIDAVLSSPAAIAPATRLLTSSSGVRAYSALIPDRKSVV